MTGTALIALYVALVGLLVPRALRQARWVVRAPRLAVALWIALSVSALVGVYALGCHLAESVATGTLRECCLTIFSGSAPAVTAVLSLSVWGILAVAVPARVIGIVCIDALRMRRRRHGHADALDLLGRPVGVSGCRALAVDHDVPAAYCVAAKGGRVVVTTAALNVLPVRELSAVVEHEKAHLHGRHALLATAAASLGRALPWIPLFSSVGPAVARLVEMAADDAAARHMAKETVARGLALMVVAAGGVAMPADAATLGATGTDVTERINRLLDIGGMERKRSAAAGTGWLMGLVAAPMAVAAVAATAWC